MPPTPRHPSRRLPLGLTILHEDRDILVVDKPAGLLTIGTESEKTRTAYFILMDYVRKGQSKSRKRIFIVHRLDRETSGVLVFAKSQEAQEFLQKNWEEARKGYLAIVHGNCEKKADTISTYLMEDKNLVMRSTPDPAQGMLSHTSYRTVKEVKEYALLEIDLLTGRKNQIRAHLAGIGHPVVGDKKYGRGGKQFPGLALHARTISFPHPFTRERVAFEAEVPGWFWGLMGGRELAPGGQEDVRREPGQ